MLVFSCSKCMIISAALVLLLCSLSDLSNVSSICIYNIYGKYCWCTRLHYIRFARVCLICTNFACFSVCVRMFLRYAAYFMFLCCMPVFVYMCLLLYVEML
ncbi:hypothetical protein GDO86_006919 [Hymenochirus boettgeri]|uniref:Uncharacterized protein n=1 Tax=Hymenochirus boettgeri TaxID=247094 RepID=A0A8T2JCS3_9PIPI|nr:hypothetical protein GDO86_006919 [Hymenochirus boettgeri]